MWLLSTARAELHYFDSPESVEDDYAILSHVWRTEEPSFQDIQALREKAISLGGTPRQYAGRKVQACCILAERHGYRWVWIDTCCIDKTSSAELSEAINSMFQWYAKADVCYAYLDDVSPGEASHPARPRIGQGFFSSQWFTRGWTLQELIAPAVVLFVSDNWSILGTKTSLVGHIQTITGIDADVLLHRTELNNISIARRFSWAAHRKTTRVEDEAYCLMGLFGVNMSTIYGEGRAAFYRLQEEVMKQSADQTIFAWGRVYELSDMLDRAL
jgi:hypothetical protein